MRRLTGTCALLTLLALLAVQVSCMFSGGAELYSMPAPAREHTELQKKLDVEIAAGWEYSAPTGGPNPSALRFIDMYGNGVPEAAAFFKHTASRLQKICLYAQSREGGDFDLIAEIEGEGDRIECAYFVDMDGDGILELIVGFRLSTGAVGGLKAYTMKDGSARELLNTEYTGLFVTDFTGDKNTDLLLLRHSDLAESARAMIYVYDGYDMYIQTAAPLSAQAKTPDRITYGTADGGYAAVAVDAAFGETRYITDMLVYEGSALINVTYDEKYHFSGQTLKDVMVYSERTPDGGIDVCQAAAIDAQSGLYRVNWSRYSGGAMRFKYASIHDYQYGWRFDLPVRWLSRVTVARVTDEAAGITETQFLAESGQKPQERVLSLYAFYGESRAAHMEESGAFLLKETDDICFAASVYTPDESFSEFAVSRDAVTELFRHDAAGAGLWRAMQ